MGRPLDLPSGERATVGVNRDAFTVFQKQVAAAGTAEQLPSTVIPHGYKLTIKAETSNTGNIEVGHTKTLAEGATTAFILDSNESITLSINNADLVWIDATISGDGVECIVEQ